MKKGTKYKDSIKIGSKCHYCLREIDQSVVENKLRIKRENAIATNKKRIANGTTTKETVPRDRIIDLLMDNVSIRKIASIVGCSPGTVQRSKNKYIKNSHE